MPSNNLAVPELADIDVKGVTRSALLVRGALAAGAVYGGSMITPFFTRKDQSWRDRSNSTFTCSAFDMSMLPSARSGV